MAVAAYRGLAQQIEQPLHLGITEAGALRGGTVKSAVGLGMLLMEGIGDTMRVSLAADPVEEASKNLNLPLLICNFSLGLDVPMPTLPPVPK